MAIKKREVAEPISIKEKAEILIQRAEDLIGPGDVVCLNSGGPNMLVMGVIDKQATCVWVADPADHCNMLAFAKFGVMTVHVVTKASHE